MIKTDYRNARISMAERAMLDFAVKLTRNPNLMDPSDLEKLRQQGLDDQAILQVTHIVGYFNYINRVADGLGVEPEPEWKNQD